jgi:hypothetical protein
MSKNTTHENTQKKEGKEKGILIRVSDPERLQIKELAAKNHIPVSKLVLDTVLKQKNLNNSKSAEIANLLCNISYEIGYIIQEHPSIKEDFDKLQKECIKLCHTLRTQ